MTSASAAQPNFGPTWQLGAAAGCSPTGRCRDPSSSRRSSPPGPRRRGQITSRGIACGFLLVALHRAGLATLTHTPAPMGFLREICGRPVDEKPLMIVVAGLPAADAVVPEHALRKKPLDRITSWL